MNQALNELDVVTLTQAYARGTLSPVEVARAVLARIEQCEPKINALYLVQADQALAQARAAEARWRAGTPLSRLDGVPVTIKENIYTRGDPAPIGTAVGDFTPKTADAPAAARLREAGCIMVGKTTMPDFGMLSSGLSSAHGTTRNPWRLDCNPAGSSSGAAAAAAAGYGPLHLGTDIGGSVRLPAFHCGIFALKPSLGRVPVDPPFMGRAAGPMTRTVRDAAFMMDVLSQPDARDFMSLPPERCDFSERLEGLSLRGLRIGLLQDMQAGWPVEPAVAQTVAAAGRALESAGAIVEPMASFMTAQMLDGIQAFFEARSCNDILALPAEQRSRILPFIVEWATWRAARFSGAQVMAAYLQVHAMREAAVKASAPFDFVLSPTAPIAAYSAEVACPHNDPHRALDHIAFTVAWNMSEQPAAALNWWHGEEGLPLGVQLIGKRFDDVGVMRLAHALEAIRPAQKAWPTLT